MSGYGASFPSFCLRMAIIFATVGSFSVTLAVPIHAHESTPDVLNKVGFEQKLNDQVPLDLVLQDKTGKLIQLGDYLGERPVILLFAYYECSNLCPLVLDERVIQELANLGYQVAPTA